MTAKAWVVSTGEWTMAWFAETRGKARVEAARFYGEEEPFSAGFSVRRAKVLDAYEEYWKANEDVPAQAWWAAGYAATCRACGEPVEESDPGAIVAYGVAYHAGCSARSQGGLSAMTKECNPPNRGLRNSVSMAIQLHREETDRRRAALQRKRARVEERKREQ